MVYPLAGAVGANGPIRTAGAMSPFTSTKKKKEEEVVETREIVTEKGYEDTGTGTQTRGGVPVFSQGEKASVLLTQAGVADDEQPIGRNRERLSGGSGGGNARGADDDELLRQRGAVLLR